MRATTGPYTCWSCARGGHTPRCAHCRGTCYREPTPAKLHPGFLRPGILGAELVNVERAIRHTLDL